MITIPYIRNDPHKIEWYLHPKSLSHKKCLDETSPISSPSPTKHLLYGTKPVSTKTENPISDHHMSYLKNFLHETSPIGSPSPTKHLLYATKPVSTKASYVISQNHHNILMAVYCLGFGRDLVEVVSCHVSVESLVTTQGRPTKTTFRKTSQNCP
jgi:hypothetical protein